MGNELHLVFYESFDGGDDDDQDDDNDDVSWRPKYHIGLRSKFNRLQMNHAYSCSYETSLRPTEINLLK